MYLDDLIERLQEVREQVPEDKNPEVLLASQPHYPLAAGIKGVVLGSELDDPDEPGEEDEDTVWLTEGSLGYDRNPYQVPRDVWDASY